MGLLRGDDLGSALAAGLLSLVMAVSAGILAALLAAAWQRLRGRPVGSRVADGLTVIPALFLGYALARYWVWGPVSGTVALVVAGLGVAGREEGTWGRKAVAATRSLLPWSMVIGIVGGGGIGADFATFASRGQDPLAAQVALLAIVLAVVGDGVARRMLERGSRAPHAAPAPEA